MNIDILNKYGISFHKQEKGFLKVNADYPNLNLAILLNRYTTHKSTIPDLIATINLVLNGKYNDVLQSEKVTWYENLGTDIYTGIIQSNLTFDVFIEDYYDKTLVTYPLIDIKEILELLLNYMNTNF